MPHAVPWLEVAHHEPLRLLLRPDERELPRPQRAAVVAVALAALAALAVVERNDYGRRGVAVVDDELDALVLPAAAVDQRPTVQYSAVRRAAGGT